MKTVKITHKQLAIDMLRGVRERLTLGHSVYICYSLSSVMDTMKAAQYRQRPRPANIQQNIADLKITRAELKEWVMESLGVGVGSYWHWVKDNVDLGESLYGFADKQKAGRIAWVEWMISELEALLPPEGEKHFPHSRVTLWK